MRAFVISGPLKQTHREILDAALLKSSPGCELDRDMFEQIYGLEYKPRFDKFCRDGKLPPLVIAYCQSKL